MKNNKLKNLAFIGWGLMMLSLVFAITETIYFRCNLLPETKAELVCDLIAQGICSVGGVLWLIGIIYKTKIDIDNVFKQTCACGKKGYFEGQFGRCDECLYEELQDN